MLGLGLGVNFVRRIISQIFQSLCSFLLDGVDESILLDSALRNTTSGVGAKFSFLYSIKLNPSGVTQAIHSRYVTSGAQRSFQLIVSSSGIISMRITDDGTATNQTIYSTVNTFTSTTIFHNIGVIIDVTQSLGSEVKILVNGIDESTTTTGPGITQIHKGTADEALGITNNGTSHFDGFINAHGQINRAITLSEYQTWENGGKPKKISDVFGTDIILEHYPQDAVFEDSEWSIVNSGWVAAPKGFLIDGVNERIACPNESRFWGNTTVAFGGWVKALTGGGDCYLSKGTSDTDPLTCNIITFGSGFRIAIHDSAGALLRYDVATGLVLDKYQYIMAVYDNSEPLDTKIRFYIDGLEVSTVRNNSVWAGIADTDEPFYIGVNKTTGSLFSSYFHGNIHSIILADNCSASQALSLYNEGKYIDPSTILTDVEEYKGNDFSWNGSAHDDLRGCLSVLTEEFDLLNSNHPGGGRSVNMEVGDLDCTDNPYI